MSDPTRLLFTLFESLSGMERPGDRAEFLAYIRRQDPAMGDRLERLLALENESGDFFDIEVAPGSCGNEPVDEPAGEGNPTEGVGTKIGRYRLIDRLGEGGCGVVYLAEQQEPVKRRVALKIIRLGMDTENVIARFEMERQSLAMMDHPNIARVYDVGATRTGRPFFVMQLVEGRKITDYCDEKNLGIPQRLRLFIKICQAIQHAHQKGVIHRDIKPSNILISENDGEAVPKVIDFGIAKATFSGIGEATTFTLHGQFLGTPAYMSPEQATRQGLDVDTRSDIFSLGSLLYELLTGRPPFDSRRLLKSDPEEIRRILQEVEPREPSAVVSSIPRDELRKIAAQRGCEPHKLAATFKGDLDRIVMKALEKDRKRRYGTADSFAADVNRYLNCEPVSARPSGPMYRFSKLVRRNKVLWAAGTTVFLSLLIGFGVSLWMYFDAHRARQAAEQARLKEMELNREARIGETIAQAAVLLKYGNIEEADKLLAKIPPLAVRPTLESAETFRTVGAWHARDGRWQAAAKRYVALAYAITSIDETDSNFVSVDIMPAAVLLCEAGDFAGYDALRTMAIRRFGNTSHPVVAEQVLKVCLLRPVDPETMLRMQSLIRYLDEGTPGERTNERAWRYFALAMVKCRSGEPAKCLDWLDKMPATPLHPPRNAMVSCVRAMAYQRLDRHAEARAEIESVREVIGSRFAGKPEIFDKGDAWINWLIARLLLREAEAGER
ncbi:MAG: serine/threonine-protein kinase [Luteolibacter sp.]